MAGTTISKGATVRTQDELTAALNKAIEQLESGAHYEWGHVGHCNCGHLVQAAFGHTPKSIYRAFGEQLGEWSEHGNLRCELSEWSVDEILESLRAIGFERQDVMHLENLSDPKILRRLPPELRYLERNRREHLILYLKTMRDLLEGTEPGGPTLVASLGGMRVQ